MKAAEILENNLNQVRTYSTESYNPNNLKTIISAYASAYGGDWNQGLRILSAGSENRPTVYQTSHLAKFGGSGLAKVENHFQINLPDSAHSFYENVRECVLSLSRVIMVLSEDGIIAHEEWHRQIYKSMGLNLPPAIIRFGRFIDEPIDFAFRKSYSDGKWRITLVASAVDSPEWYFSSEADGHDTDEDINIWMKRMIDTDAYPLRPGHEEVEHRDALRLA